MIFIDRDTTTERAGNGGREGRERIRKVTISVVFLVSFFAISPFPCIRRRSKSVDILVFLSLGAKEL